VGGAGDRIGIKPLFYRLANGRLESASELRAVAELQKDSGGRFEVDLQAIYDFFRFRYVPAPGTFYKGVQKLPPGHDLLADRSGARTVAWWDLPAEEEGDAPDLSAKAWGEQVIGLLRESVRLRLIADVPVGVFLSGVVDSSAVVALAAQLSAHPLRTFSAGFEEAQYSELPAARQTACAFRTEHQELVVRASDLAAAQLAFAYKATAISVRLDGRLLAARIIFFVFLPIGVQGPGAAGVVGD
jgi:asparagine synthase (glutamine-hydrolysing)